MSDVKADANVEPTTDAIDTTAANATAVQPDAKKEEPVPDVQELMVELAKLKRAKDKLTAESAEWRKKYQSKLSEQEKASEEKAEREAEREEQFQQLLKENTISKTEKMYLGLGWTADEAAAMAVAEYDNDPQAKMKLQMQVQERMSKEAMEKFLRSRPDIQFGTGNSGISKEQFDKMMADMDIEALTKFKREHPDEYEKYKAMP